MRERTMIFGLVLPRRQAPGSCGPLGWRPSGAADTRRRHPAGLSSGKTARRHRAGPGHRRKSSARATVHLDTRDRAEPAPTGLSLFNENVILTVP